MKLVSEKGFSTDDRQDRDWQLKSTGKIFFPKMKKKLNFSESSRGWKIRFFQFDVFNIKAAKRPQPIPTKNLFSAIYAMLESELFYWVEITHLT